jgi:2-polyprenyl-3-methyl-5-hydroxy-6-metoxy-1,4-benzoquinol methylase
MDPTTSSPTVPRSCWACGSTRNKLWKERSAENRLSPQDLRITDSRYGMTLRLFRCQDCTFIFADDDEVRELYSLYEQLQDPAYEATSESRALQMQWLIERGRAAHKTARRLLEIGSGSGLLVASARKAGLDAIGIEPSRSLVAAARRITGIELLQGSFPHPAVAGLEFDLIYLVDVIEHVSDPVSLLGAMREALAPGGLAIVVTPNISSFVARLLRRRWWHLRLAHVGYFDRNTMNRAAERAGMQIVDEFCAQWFFSVVYLADRLAEYLPIRWLNKLVVATPLGRLYQKVVALNLGDSDVFILRAK